MSKLYQRAIAAIEKNKACLVYPMKNQSLPVSLWSALFPRSTMEWDWSEEADSKVNQLWILREELSRSKEVVYSKWYRGRATFFSREIFPYFLAALRDSQKKIWTPETEELLELLQMDSPLSTKKLKVLSELRGRLLEPTYNRALKPLWASLDLVGLGEVDEGAFPSLLIAATSSAYEELYLSSQEIDSLQAYKHIVNELGEDNRFVIYLEKLLGF